MFAIARNFAFFSERAGKFHFHCLQSFETVTGFFRFQCVHPWKKCDCILFKSAGLIKICEWYHDIISEILLHIQVLVTFCWLLYFKDICKIIIKLGWAVKLCTERKPILSVMVKLRWHGESAMVSLPWWKD